jgi:hypothetical protein
MIYVCNEFVRVNGSSLHTIYKNRYYINILDVLIAYAMFINFVGFILYYISNKLKRRYLT